ncbi:MAG: hypothetical protein PHF00_09070, partial [Elusimicrobia bacterium]|nr:hypothetical protein [Elusimicrobiota bacterium]
MSAAKCDVTVTTVVDPDATATFDLLRRFLANNGEEDLDCHSMGRIREAIKGGKIVFYVAASD